MKMQKFTIGIVVAATAVVSIAAANLYDRIAILPPVQADCAGFEMDWHQIYTPYSHRRYVLNTPGGLLFISGSDFELVPDTYYDPATKTMHSGVKLDGCV